MTDSSNPYYVAYLREKQARIEVEQLLEVSTRLLYEKNQLLEQQIAQIRQQQQSVIKQEKLALLGTLAAGVAHEINNPLAFILSNIDTFGAYGHILLQALQQSPFNPTLPARVNVIAQDLPELIADTSQGLLRIKDIVNNLLFFARADTEAPSEVQLADAVEFTLQLLQPMLHQTELQKDYQPTPAILFHLNELNQVLLNIIVNAVQACEAVPDRPGQIRLRIHQAEQQLILRISDNGCGMSEDTMHRMFDAFFTTKTVGTGTGVGMAIVWQTLQQHDCQIDVHSELGQGTDIEIRFPLPASGPIAAEPTPLNKTAQTAV